MYIELTFPDGNAVLLECPQIARKLKEVFSDTEYRIVEIPCVKFTRNDLFDYLEKKAEFGFEAEKKAVKASRAAEGIRQQIYSLLETLEEVEA